MAPSDVVTAVTEHGNREALGRLFSANPVWTDVRLARDVTPLEGERWLLHSGPPIAFEDMPGCAQGAAIGTVLLERWARSPVEARSMLASGAVPLHPGHPLGCVAPVAGIVGPSSSLFVVEDHSNGNTAYSPLNEGLGEVVRYGAFSDAALGRARWLEATVAPLLCAAVRSLEGVPLLEVMSEALHMGDELHNRSKAFSRLLLGLLAVELHRCPAPHLSAAAGLEFIRATDIFFLNLSMAVCKAALMSAKGVSGSSLVHTMTQNGREFGVQIAGLPDRWFTAPAPIITGIYRRPWTAAEACPGLGDSIITETLGLGAFAVAGAPAIVRYIGGSPAAALTLTESMYTITLGEHPRLKLPVMEYRGVPSGIDAHLVVRENRPPVLNAGIAHRDAGIGQIGAGYIVAPIEPFISASSALGLGDSQAVNLGETNG